MAKIRRKIPEGLVERLESLLKQCRNERETRRVQAILLYAKHGWGYEQVAAATGYSPLTVRDLQTAFFRDGESVLIRRQKPAERRQYLKRVEEAAFLERFAQSAKEGELVSVADIQQAYEKRVGKEVAPSTIYRLLERHRWRKVVPPYSPQLNPIENLWKVIRERFFPNLDYERMDTLEENLADTLLYLEETPQLVQSVTGYKWLLNLISA